MATWQIICAAAATGYRYSQQIIADLEATGIEAKRSEGGIHHKCACKSAAYSQLVPEHGANVDGERISISHIKAAKLAKMKHWSKEQLKDNILQVEADIEKVKKEVCHSVCIVNVCLSKIRVVS